MLCIDCNLNINVQTFHRDHFLDHGMSTATATFDGKKEQDIEVVRRRVLNDCLNIRIELCTNLVQCRAGFCFFQFVVEELSMLLNQFLMTCRGQCFFALTAKAFRFGMEDVTVVGNRQLESGLADAQAEIIFFPVTLWERLFIQQANLFQDCCFNHEAEAVDKLDLRKILIGGIPD